MTTFEPMITDDGHCPEQIRREHCKHASSHWPPAQPGTIEPAPWNGGPGNRRDRGRFLVLSADRRKAASDLAASKSGGTLTAARCWAEALDETAGPGDQGIRDGCPLPGPGRPAPAGRPERQGGRGEDGTREAAMRDPHVHVERGIALLTHAQMREALARVTGLAASAPKTVTTGCNVRRPYAMTSGSPAAVTCLACRDHAAAQHGELAASAEALLRLAAEDPETAASLAARPGGAAAIASLAREHRAAAAAFGPARA